MKRSLLTRATLKASTMVEMMIVMIITGVVIGLIFEGIDLFRRYSYKITDEIVTSGDMLNTYLSLETIVGRSDSLTDDGEIVQLHRKGAVIGKLELVDSSLVINFLEHTDTLPQKVKSIEVNWGTKMDTLMIETEAITFLFQTAEQAEITTTENEYYEDESH